MDSIRRSLQTRYPASTPLGRKKKSRKSFTCEAFNSLITPSKFAVMRSNYHPVPSIFCTLSCPLSGSSIQAPRGLLTPPLWISDLLKKTTKSAELWRTRRFFSVSIKSSHPNIFLSKYWMNSYMQKIK